MSDNGYIVSDEHVGEVELVLQIVQKVQNLALDRYIVVSAYRDDRKQWRWNGYMWREIPVETKHWRTLSEDVHKA